MPRKSAHPPFDTLKAIEDRAFELFGRYGYEGVSIGDIAAAARLSKGALYWHFKGKQALYLQCLRRLHALFEAHILKPMQADPNPVTGIVRLFSGLQTMMQDPLVENGVAGYWLTPPTPETAAIIDMQRRFEFAAVATLREVLQRGVDQEQLDFAGDLDAFAHAIVSLVEACVLALRHKSPEEIGGQLAVLGRTLFRAYARSEDTMSVISQALATPPASAAREPASL